MANPQLENGHTQIANEVLEHLMRIHLSPNQWQVVLCIIRKTYGFHKKVDHLTNSQICEITGIRKAHVSRAMAQLIARKIVTRAGKMVGFQKDYEQWQKLPVLVTNNTGSRVTSFGNKTNTEVTSFGNKKLPVLVTEVTSFGNKKLPAQSSHKRKKETIQKKYKRYGEFQNVLLTDNEYHNLQLRFEGRVEDLVETLSVGIESKGYKYKSHYAAILTWARRDSKGGNNGKYQGYSQKRDSTKLPDRKTGYTEPPPDPELARLVEAAERNGEFS